MFFERVYGKCQLILECLENRCLLTTIGRLDIEFFLDHVNYGNHTHKLNYTDLGGVLDTLDSYDVLYPGFPAPSPLDVHSKMVSLIPQETETDVKILNNMSPTNYSGSLISRDGSPVQVSDLQNELRVTIVTYEGFVGKPIILQTDTGQRYDVRVLTDDGMTTGIVPLPDLNGTYASEDEIISPKIHFRKSADLNNDGSVDVVDLALMAENWLNYEGMPGASGEYQRGDITGPDGVPDGSVNLLDFTEMSNQWSG